MTRQHDGEKLRQREAIRGRIKFVLEYKWSGNQRQMARDLGVSSGLVSKIINGQQGAGKRFLATLARQPGINSDWLQEGDGPPLFLEAKGTLPVALGVLPGSPLDYPHLLIGQRQPVPTALDRGTRYWLELQASTLLLRDTTLSLLAGDLLLIETDAAWTSRLDLIDGRLCGIRCQQGEHESVYRLGKLTRDPAGTIFDTLDRVFRLATEAPLQARPTSTSQATRSRTTTGQDAPRRKVRNLEREAEKATARQQAQEQRQQEVSSQSGSEKDASEQEQDRFAVEDVVGVCIYLARPSPRVAARG